MADTSFLHLLYRYFFFGWLFKDVCRGNRYERLMAWEHNRRQARWLGTYLRRWMIVGLSMFMLGASCETLLQAPALSALFFVPMAVSLSINTVIGALIIGFKSLSEPR